MKPIEIEIIPVSGDRISVSVNYNVPGSVPMIRRWQVGRAIVDEISQNLGELVAAAMAGARPGSSLENAGSTFFEALFREQCDRLREAARGGGVYFLFKVDRSLAYLPFEILHDGEKFISQHFPLGRVIYSEAGMQHGTGAAVSGNRALILGDPSDDPAIRDDVEREIDALRDLIKMRGEYGTTIAMGREVSERLILSLLPDSALLHFTGHGAESPDGSAGLELHGGEVLSACTFRGLRHVPAVAFFNTCSTASHRAWRSPLGIMEALISRGTRACIAPVWDVASGAATALALSFYEHLLSGDTFGEALRKARAKTARDRSADDPTWAAYALYGNPMSGLREMEAPAGRVRTRLALRVFFALLIALLLILSPKAVDRRMPDVVAPVEVGYVILESEPSDARIFIDGEEVGLTPTAIEVSVGEHRVALMKKGYRRWQASVDVKKSPETVVRAQLQEIEG